MTRMLRALSLPSLALVAVTGCSTPHRRMDDIDSGKPAADSAARKKDIEVFSTAEMNKNKPVPAPTMTTKQIRAELWSIAARRQRGEAGQAIADYAARLAGGRTLENRFLAAAAIADDDEAWKAFNALYADYPRYYWGHAGMAMIYSHWKVRDMGEKEAGFMLDLAADNTFTYTIRGNLYRNLGDNQAAIRDYATALRADPTDADARVGLAIARKATGTPAGFKEELERALKDVPTQYEAANELATLLDEGEDKAVALAAWDRVAKLNPKNRTAQLALARLQGDANPAGAIAAYEKAGRQSPLSKAEQESLTKLYHQQGRIDDEIASLNALAKLDTKDLTPFKRIAEISEGRNDPAGTEAAYQAILKVSEKDPDALLGLGRVAEKRSQVRQAIDLYRQAKAAGSAKAGAEAARLATACLLPERPLTGGNLNGFYSAVAQSLNKIFEKRLAEAPRLKGEMKVKIETDGEGKVITASITENTLNDPWLEAHLYFSVADSAIPKLKAADPKRFSLTFDLPSKR